MLTSNTLYCGVRYFIGSGAGGFFSAAIKLHKRQLMAINYRAPLKMLVIAHSQRAARLMADEINAIMNQDFAACIVSSETAAKRELFRVKGSKSPLAYVAVNMITEGFNDPNISVIAYASNVTALLYVTQMMARAMRITDVERAVPMVLPANILIPDVKPLRKVFAAALATTLHELDENQRIDGPEENDRDRGPWGDRLPVFSLLGLSDPQLISANVLDQEDGEVLAPELDHYLAACANIGIPQTFAPRIAVIARRPPPSWKTYSRDEPLTAMPANPRDVNLAHRARINELTRYMVAHISHEKRFQDVRQFQAKANEAAGIPNGARDQADNDKLKLLWSWVRDRVVEHCQTHNEPLQPYMELEQEEGTNP